MNPETNPDTLNDQFAIPNTAQVVTGQGGLPLLRLTPPCGSMAEVYLHGAHVTQFQPPNQEPLFYVSNTSGFAPGVAIRSP